MWKKIAVFIGVLTCSLALVGSESRGMISKVSLDSGFIEIDGESYPVRTSELQVVFQDRKFDTDDLQKGFLIRFSVSENGFVEKIQLTGPEERIQRLLSH